MFKLSGCKIFFLPCLILFGIFASQNVQAATSYFSPSSGNFTVGNIFTVNVSVNTEGAVINNAEATVNFPSGLLEIVSISKSGSVFSLWVEEPSFSNRVGTLSFNGGLPTPGFTGTAGKILSVVFRAKKAGSASLIFSSAAIRANDGYGTNVLGSMSGASFNIVQAKGVPKIETPVIELVGPNITSTTHPDQNKWYSNNDPVFEWQLPNGTRSVKLVLAKNLSSSPLVAYDPPISKKELSDVADGVWYFKVQFDTGEVSKPIASYKFQIDTEKPADFVVTRVDNDDPTNPQPELLFESSDSVSGIDYYEMKIGDGDWFKIEPKLAGKPYKLPLQAPGARNIIVKAFDRAGNFSEAVYNLSIVEPPTVSIVKQISKLLFQIFDSLVNFLSKDWLLVILGAFGAAMVYWLAKEVVPFLIREIRKISYIAGEYKLDKRLSRHNRKVQSEVKILYDDLQKELALFKKIKQHRGLHPEEKYFKEKIEKYLRLIKAFRRVG